MPADNEILVELCGGPRDGERLSLCGEHGAPSDIAFPAPAPGTSMMMKAGAPIPPNTRCARYERRCEIAPGLKVFSVIVYDFKDYVTI